MESHNNPYSMILSRCSNCWLSSVLELILLQTKSAAVLFCSIQILLLLRFMYFWFWHERLFLFINTKWHINVISICYCFLVMTGNVLFWWHSGPSFISGMLSLKIISYWFISNIKYCCKIFSSIMYIVLGKIASNIRSGYTYAKDNISSTRWEERLG